MNLAYYEQELVDQIYNVLVEDGTPKVINLYGDIGCGKSTIAYAVANQLQEGWSTFYIEGIDPNLSPYLTWHIGTKLYSRKKLDLGSEILFGVSFHPVPISIEVGNSFQREQINYILTPSEEALISNIKNQVGGNQNILFIADNYEQWDIPSKQFLQKIMIPKLKLLSTYRLFILLISHKQLYIDKCIQLMYIPVSDISDDSILFVLRQRGYFKKINIEDIMACAGNNLSLALMAANYYAKNTSKISDFNAIMDRRCNNLNPQELKACKILEPLSIIDSCFTKEETAYFIDPSPQDKYETEFQAEEYLSLAEEQLFITGNESYHFTNSKIKEYFRIQLARSERFYHRKFADFLKRRHPEDYFNRGKHLMLSMQANDPMILFESWQLYLLSYIRRATEIGNTNDVYNILDEINNIFKRLSPALADIQRHVLAKFISGYKAFVKYDYRNALYHFQAITPSRLISACLAECQRLILLCHIQLAENLGMIIQAAEELYNTIETNEILEDEQYCRATLVLLDVYLDRSNNYQRVNVLKNKFIRIIQCHIGCPTFEEFEACYNRKAALHYAALIAYQQTAQSVNFYRSCYNRNGLYMALCNHAGNSIVSGHYDEAKIALSECRQMIKYSEGWYYPSQYKIENNKILLNYLIDEKNAIENPDKIFAAAQNAIAAFRKIMDHQEDETSHVIFFNYLGLSILCNSYGWQSELIKANKSLTELDEYYQYYLHDLNFAAALLYNDYLNAQNELTILKTLDVPLLRHYNPIFLKRRYIQEELLNDSTQLKGNPIEYHRKIFTGCAHIQDPSCYFYGRGFLLSDLQFLSF